jgi:hypothetical protein
MSSTHIAMESIRSLDAVPSQHLTDLTHDSRAVVPVACHTQPTVQTLKDPPPCPPPA